MNGYLAFMKKEWMEQIRTYKLFILLVVFFIFGMLSPLTAKLMPELLSQFPIEGMTIILPEPSAIDSYTQFFKNCSQMGLLILVIVFSGSLTHELMKGTLINLVTKGLSRSAIIVSKFTVSLLIWTISLLLSFITTWFYTVYLFGDDEIYHLFSSVGCLWLFGVFLLSLSLLAQTLIESQYGNLTMIALSIGGLFALNLFPKFQEYNPLVLISKNVSMLSQDYELASLLSSVGITGGLSITCLMIAIYLFKTNSI